MGLVSNWKLVIKKIKIWQACKKKNDMWLIKRAGHLSTARRVDVQIGAGLGTNMHRCSQKNYPTYDLHEHHLQPGDAFDQKSSLWYQRLKKNILEIKLTSSCTSAPPSWSIFVGETSNFYIFLLFKSPYLVA